MTKALTRPKKVDQSPKMLTSFSETTGESARIDEAGPLGHSGLAWSYILSLFYREIINLYTDTS